VPAHPGSPGQNPEGRKTVVVVVVGVVVQQLVDGHQLSDLAETFVRRFCFSCFTDIGVEH